MLFSQCKGDIVDILFFAIRLGLTGKKEQNRGKNGCQRLTMVFQMTQKFSGQSGWNGGCYLFQKFFTSMSCIV